MPAPYSDNLYSGDGDASDDDQLDDDVLSPTDGYFHASSASHAVPNVLVEDPSLMQAAKAREAEEERLMINSSRVGHSSQSQPQSQSLSQSPSESHQPSISITNPPSHQPGDAPPAYSPSPLSPPPVSGYQTFAAWNVAAYPDTMGLPEEHQALLPRQPQSMGGGSSSDSGPSVWRRLTDSTSSDTRRKVKTLLGVLVIASVFFALFGIGSGGRALDIVDNTPVKRPETSPRHDMTWRPSSDCLNTPSDAVKITEYLTFGTDKNLAVVHIVENVGGNRRGTPVHVSGAVILQPVDASAAGAIQFEIISNYQDQNVRVEFDRRNQGFVIITPRSIIGWPQSRPAQCLQLRVTIFIPRKSHLRSFSVESTLLDIQIKDGLVLTSSGGSSLNAVSGRIHTGLASGDLAPYTLASRTIEIDTVSGSVDGWFPLYDVLSITTVSGNVNADVAPKSSADKEPGQAVLSVSSVSGNVRIREPLDQVNASDSNFPSRDFVVDVKAASGHIDCDLAFTSSAKFESQSSDFRLRLLPLFYSSYSSRPTPVLVTDTKSGDTKLTVLEPVWTDPAAGVVHHGDEDHGLSFLESHHSSVSGDSELAYPESWEGKLSMSTISGSQNVRGEGLRLTRSGTVLKKLYGTKGDGYSQLTVESMSGDEDVYIGGRDGKH